MNGSGKIYKVSQGRCTVRLWTIGRNTFYAYVRKFIVWASLKRVQLFGIYVRFTGNHSP
jgi:hypothetical protein